MKRLIFSFFIIFLSLSISAQHLKFMGIPIDGNINTFASKLNAKGFSISPLNKDAGVGLRIMVGRFFNEAAQLWISYTPSTKTVYSVRVVFWSDSETVCKSFKEELEESIKEKYDYEYEDGKTMGGTPINVYYIYTNDIYEGQIYVGVSEHKDLTYGFHDGYDVNLTYQDYINSSKDNNRKENDI